MNPDCGCWDSSPLSREEKIERLTNALWRATDEKLAIVAAVMDL